MRDWCTIINFLWMAKRSGCFEWLTLRNRPVSRRIRSHAYVRPLKPASFNTDISVAQIHLYYGEYLYLEEYIYLKSRNYFGNYYGRFFQKFLFSSFPMISTTRKKVGRSDSQLLFCWNVESVNYWVNQTRYNQVSWV